jgi:hypothetical protein
LVSCSDFAADRQAADVPFVLSVIFEPRSRRPTKDAAAAKVCLFSALKPVERHSGL